VNAVFFFGGGARVWPVNAISLFLSLAVCVLFVCVCMCVCLALKHARESIYEQHILTYTNMLHELHLIYTQAHTPI
jgi:hypothetical protein